MIKKVFFINNYRLEVARKKIFLTTSFYFSAAREKTCLATPVIAYQRLTRFI